MTEFKVGNKVCNVRAFSMFASIADEDNWDIITVPKGTIGTVKFVGHNFYEVQFPQREETYTIGGINLRMIDPSTSVNKAINIEGRTNHFIGGAWVRIERAIAANIYDENLFLWEHSIVYPPIYTEGVVANDWRGTVYDFVPEYVRVLTDEYPDYGIRVYTRDLTVVQFA